MSRAKSERKKDEEAMAINDALYAAREANNVNRLVTYMPYHRGIAGSRPTRRPELMALAEAMTDRAADMLLKAFDGKVNGKKIPKPRKAHK